MALAPGTTLGPYVIVAAISAGGMGEVYRARDTRLGRLVAVKILPPEIAGDADRLRRFAAEARIAASLDHPNVVPVYDVGTDNGVSFIVMALVDGRTLRQVLREERLTVPRAVTLATEVADGLAAAHARGIVHRDLKPENIVVSSDGHARILDFGLAKAADLRAPGDAPTESVSGPEPIFGTAGYMAPEQASGLQADHRADIFSFGAVLYEMLSGRRAFGGETSLERRLAAMRDTPSSLTSTAERPCPFLLVRIVERCLEKSPAARFQSVPDLIFALRSVSDLSTTAAPGVTPLLAGTSSVSRVFPWVMAAAGAATAALVLVLWPRQPPPRVAQPVYRMEIDSGTEEFQVGRAWCQFALSPDGRSLVYAARPIGGTAAGRLYLRRLERSEALPMAGTAGALRPFFSPDSQWVAFSTDRDFKKVRVDGTEPMTLINNLPGVGGSWGTDGVMVLAGGSPGGIPGALVRLAEGGGTPSAPIAVADAKNGEIILRHPDLLPDGSTILTIVKVDRRLQVAVLPRRGPMKVLVENAMHPRYLAPGYLVFARGSTLFVAPFDANRLELTGPAVAMVHSVKGDVDGGTSNFSVSRDGSLAYIPGTAPEVGLSSVVWLDRTGGAETPLGFQPHPYRFALLSADDSRLGLLTQNDAGQGAVWIGDLARQSLAPLTDSTSNVEAAYGLTWSPDGTSVVYRKADRSLWSRRVDLSAPEQHLLPTAPPGNSTGFWAPGGRTLLFGGVGDDPRLGQDIWLVTPPTVGERISPVPQPWLQTRASESPAAFSPDGRWLAYFSNLAVTDNLYVRPFPGSGPVSTLTNEGALRPVAWRGSELFYQVNGSVMAVKVEPGDAISPGRPTALFKIPAGMRYVGPSADGQRFLFLKDEAPAAAAPPPTKLTVVVNWIEEVRQRLAQVR